MSAGDLAQSGRTILLIGLDRVISRIATVANEVGEQFPYCADRYGKWKTTSDGDWCGGHWVGMLWIAYRRTGEPRFHDLALRLTRRLAERVSAADMFRGSIHYYSAALGADLLGDDALAEIAVRAAEGICAMYNPRASMIPLGTEAQISGSPVSGDEKGAVDNAMVPLIIVWWAWRRTGRAEFAEVATAVSKQVCQWFIRPDGSTWQLGVFNPHTGELLSRETVLGYSNNSCWSRGQSWLLYGLANAYRHARDATFLNNARQVWNFARRNLPDDLIPFYDFADPRIPNVPRDTSAGALLAAGLYLLSAVGSDEATYYRQMSQDIATSLINSYLTDDGRLLRGCFNFPKRVAPDNELIWGNYYLLETLDHLTS